VLGGEVSLWLALAYDAAGQRAECISLYKLLEDTHSSREIRKQAYELRFILEAPKLELSPDELVSIPLPEEASAFSDKWSRARSPRAKPVARSWEDEWLENYTPPEIASNRFVLAATRCDTIRRCSCTSPDSRLAHASLAPASFAFLLRSTPPGTFGTRMQSSSLGRDSMDGHTHIIRREFPSLSIPAL